MPNQKFAFKSTSGPIKFNFVQAFASAPGGTKIEIHVEMEPGGFFKLAEGALAGNLKQTMEAQAEKLRKVLEGA